MNPPAVQIEEFRLRVPGLSRGEARRLGEEVARGLAEELSGSEAPRHLGALELRLRSSPGASPAALAGEIVAALCRTLR